MIVDAAAACAVIGPVHRAVDTRVGDGQADFAVRAVRPQPVSGTVTTSDGAPVPDAEITVTPPGGGTPVRTTTDAEGHYLVDGNAIGSGYSVAITGVPSGFDISGPSRHAFDVANVPVTGQDFVLAERPSVGGTVTDGDTPLAGVTVTLTPHGGGGPITTVTGPDGRYQFTHVPTGVYDASVTAPEGFRAVAPIIDVTVSSRDRTGLDFTLTRPGTIAGAVHTADDAAVSGAEITVTGAGATTTTKTDSTGEYLVDGLDAGAYVVELTPPTGFDVVGPVRRPADITAAGEIRGGLDFTVRAAEAGTTPPSTPSSPAVPLGGGSLSNSGARWDVPLAAGLLLVGTGAALVVAGTRRRRPRVTSRR